MNRTLAILCAALFLTSSPLRAQEAAAEGAPAEDTPQFASEVELVDVDVVVTDKKGRPIKGLTAADFSLEEDGDPQTISRFEAIELPDEPIEEVPERPPVSTNIGVKEETGRTMVVLFDDIHLGPQMAQRAKNAVTEFLERGTRAGDRVTLVAPADGTWWTSRMPHGRTELIQVLKRLEGRNIEPYRGPDRLTEWEAMRIHVYRDEQVIARVSRRFDTYGVNPLGGSRGQLSGGDYDPLVYGRATEVYYQALTKNRITLEVMQRVLESLENTSGRKSVILVSEGFIYDPNMDEFKRIKEASRRSNAAVYFLDTRGLEGISVYNTAEFGPAMDTRDLGSSFLDSLEASAGSESIAIDTGGFTVKNTNDLGEGIQRIADEARNYYIIGYHPTNRARDGRFRKIEVDVARDDIKVRARKGYYAPSDSPTALDREATGIDPQLQAALDSPFEQPDVPIRMTEYVFEETLLGKARVMLAAEVDLRNFAFEERLDVTSGKPEGARFVDTLEFIMVVAHRETGEFFTYNQKVEMKLRRETLDKVGGSWFPLSREFELQKGAYQAKLVIRDANSKTVGTLTHEFTIPDLSTLRASTPILTDTLVPQPQTPDAPPRPRVLARRFFPAGTMLYTQYEIYGAAKDDDGMPRVIAGYEVRRADGSVHTKMEPTPIRPTSLGSLARFMGTRLEGAAPGDYELVIEARDDIGGKSVTIRAPFTLVAAEEPVVHFANLREGPPLGVTAEKFDRVANGMKYEDVSEIVGQEGREMSRDVVGTVTTVVYTWSNDDGSKMTATFKNGSLVSKEQVDLPRVAGLSPSGGAS